MRNAFADELTTLAAEDKRVVLLSGDIGNRLFNPFKASNPDRFYNCGVAEANMIGVAAGLALSGLRPVAYTITPFITTRCLEQIRVDLCYQQAPVVIVGVGSGLSYASLGPTHHSCEDIACLRALPGMTVVCPGDPVEVRAALRAALQQPGPVYLRLGKKGEPTVHQGPLDFAIGRAIPVRRGRQVCLLSTGSLLPGVCQAAEELETRGISAQVVSFHTVKPLDVEFLARTFARFPLVAVVEEHGRAGGLGGAVAEWLADQSGHQGALIRLGTADRFLRESGDQNHAREQFGLDPRGICEAVGQRLGAMEGSAS